MTLGVSWSGQLVFSALSFCFGLAGGVVTVLYHFPKKSNKIERALVDFFATMLLLSTYFLAVEVGGKGQTTAYSLAFFLLGVWISSRLLKLLSPLRARWRRRKFFKK